MSEFEFLSDADLKALVAFIQNPPLQKLEVAKKLQEQQITET